MTAVKLIATDLDGTLLRSDGTVSQHTVDTLRSAADAGITIVVATGRPLRWMRPVADMLGHTGIAICANGALVYDLHDDKVIGTRPIAPDAVLNAAKAVRQALPDVTFATESVANGFGHEPNYVKHFHDTSLTPVVAPLGELVTDDIIKLLVQHRGMGADELLKTARDVAGDFAEFTHSSRDGLLEMSATNVTKASTLAGIAGDRGLTSRDVVAFGDMPNDLPMLAWAGTGYAMANAHADVLAAAEHVAPSNDDDGVASVLARLLT